MNVSESVVYKSTYALYPNSGECPLQYTLNMNRAESVIYKAPYIPNINGMESVIYKAPYVT